METIPEQIQKPDQKKLAIQHATWRLMNAVLSGDYIEEVRAEEALKKLENQ